jgi:hypothetical protein
MICPSYLTVVPLALGFIVLATTTRGELSLKALTALVCILSNGYVFELLLNDKGIGIGMGWAILAASSGVGSAAFVLHHILSSVLETQHGPE